MNAPEDQNGLREALARAEAERDEADRRAGAAERKHEAGLDDRLKADRWKRHRKAERGYDESVSFDRVWAETSAKADRAVAAEARFTTVQATLDAEMEIQAEVRASLRAAEAEITRLKEGMEAAVGAHLESLCEPHRGFVMIHDGLAESTRPKQSSGEVCAYWRDRFADEIGRHVALATLSQVQPHG